MTRELTPEEKRIAFIRATRGMSGAAERWKERAARGMTDEELVEALKYELGIEGGASATDTMPAYHVKGAGLQVWASWEFPRVYQDKPIFQGAAAIAMAREAYGIRDPGDRQIDLFS